MVLNTLLIIFVGYTSLLHKALSFENVNRVKVVSDDVDVIVQGKDTSHAYLDLMNENCERNILEKYEFRLFKHKDMLYIEIKRKVHGPFNKDLSNLRCNLKLVLNVLPVREINVETASGDIIIKNCTVKSLLVKSASGDVSLHSPRIENVNIRTASGDVNLNGVTNARNINIETASGDVEINKCPDAGTLTISTASGDVSLEIDSLKTFRKIRAITVSGDIRFTTSDEHTKVCVSTSTGDIVSHNFINIESYSKKCNVLLKTSSGDINIERL